MSPQHKPSVSNIPSCDWQIEKLPGLSQQEQLQLQNCGITTTKALIQHSKTPDAKLALANKLHIHLQYVNKWVALADLARIPSVGTQYCGLLLHAGVISVTQLANTPPHRLHKQVLRLLVSTMQRRDLCPSIEQVQQWTQQAKRLAVNC
jgi:predicted flap endonuclease-1-like 5' DNA nuclease